MKSRLFTLLALAFMGHLSFPPLFLPANVLVPLRRLFSVLILQRRPIGVQVPLHHHLQHLNYSSDLQLNLSHYHCANSMDHHR